MLTGTRRRQKHADDSFPKSFATEVCMNCPPEDRWRWTRCRKKMEVGRRIVRVERRRREE